MQMHDANRVGCHCILSFAFRITDADESLAYHHRPAAAAVPDLVAVLPPRRGVRLDRAHRARGVALAGLLRLRRHRYHVADLLGLLRPISCSGSASVMRAR